MIKLESENHSLLTPNESYIIGLYLGGKSTVELSKMFTMSSEGIRKVLKRHNIRRRTTAETSSVHVLNHQYFDVINDKTKAFWLGFITRFGIVVRRNTIMLIVNGSHLDLLERFKREISFSKTIYKSKNRNRYSLTIASAQFVEKLSNLEWQTNLLAHIKPELHPSVIHGLELE